MQIEKKVMKKNNIEHIKNILRVELKKIDELLGK